MNTHPPIHVTVETLHDRFTELACEWGDDAALHIAKRITLSHSIHSDSVSARNFEWLARMLACRIDGYFWLRFDAGVIKVGFRELAESEKELANQ